jgi:Protein of unknown function (DUF2950)
MMKLRDSRIAMRLSKLGASGVAAVMLSLANPFHGALAASEQAMFDRPEMAVDALLENLKNRDVDGLAKLFGQEQWDRLVGPDKTQAREGLLRIYEAAQVSRTLVPGDSGAKVLIVGSEGWPFPIPLIPEQGQWRFDTEAGIQEVINRRIGSNELKAIMVMYEYVTAQVRYAGIDRDGDDVLEYAQKIASTPGKRDGLHWVSQEPDDESPLGPFVSESAAYLEGRELGDPFRGYYFRVLTRQGDGAPGERYDYIINGNMIAGFAMIAYPAEYGNSGIMSFIVNQQGVVYERDLGEETAIAAQSMMEYDPDGWSESE